MFHVIAGVIGLAWMLCMRYLLIDRHRQKYLPVIMADKRASMPTDPKTTPWVTLFFKSAFW